MRDWYVPYEMVYIAGRGHYLRASVPQSMRDGGDAWQNIERPDASTPGETEVPGGVLIRIHTRHDTPAMIALLRATGGKPKNEGVLKKITPSSVVIEETP